KWMTQNDTTHWSEGLLPVVYGINTRMSSTIKTSPYQVMFGQAPRLESDFWKLVAQDEILDEEDLPTPVALGGDVDDDVVISKERDTTWDDVIDPDVTKLVQKLTDEALSNSLIDIISPTRNCTSSIGINNSFVDNLISFDSPPENTALSSTQPSSSSLPSTSSRHDLIRQTATNNYLTGASKRMKLHHNYVDKLTDKFNINDCVEVQIHTAGRTNTDPKLLPCIVIEKNKKGDSTVFKLARQYGVLQNSFSVDHFVELKSSCPQVLKELNIGELNDISF
ncbi:unnamed protein product, partial [Didymodactylos carnosus]